MLLGGDWTSFPRVRASFPGSTVWHAMCCLISAAVLVVSVGSPVAWTLNRFGSAPIQRQRSFRRPQASRYSTTSSARDVSSMSLVRNPPERLPERSSTEGMASNQGTSNGGPTNRGNDPRSWNVGRFVKNLVTDTMTGGSGIVEG